MNKTKTLQTVFLLLSILICFEWSSYSQQAKDQASTGKKVSIGTSFVEKTTDLGKALLKVKSSNYLDYDEENDFIYGRERTKITYGKYELEADKVILDVRLKEAQASGNVILISLVDKIYADTMIYNFEKEMGTGTNIYGQHRDMYFKGPSFERLNKQEVLFRKDSVTTCDFIIPHYRIRAKEFVLYVKQRIFAKNAILYLREIPIFYFPVYTRSLWEENPWDISVGVSSRLGAFLQVGYNYRHKVDIPNPVTGKMETLSKSKLSYHLDWYSTRGVGYGITYRYNLNYEKNKGIIDLYTIKDKNFGGSDNNDEDVTFEDGTWGSQEIEGGSRYKAYIQHRTQITDDLVWTLFADTVSDPNVYFDFFDELGNDRGRLAERRGFTALTLTKDDFVFRILFELKQRLSRDRLENFSEPTDDDLDFEVDTSVDFDSERYGDVTRRLPQINFTTRYLNIGQSKWYYNVDINALNNLYSGLNIMSDDDNVFVRGFDIYQSVLRRIKFSDKYTLLTKFGIGVGFFDFDEDSALGVDFAPGTVFPTAVDGLTFVDEDTFLIGTKERSFSDVNSGFIYADALLRFTARFTDYLKGTLQYRFRQGTEDSLGNFLDSIAQTETRDDVYNFRLNEHWLEGKLEYYFSKPDLSMYVSAGHNLQSNSEVFADELLDYLGMGATYQSPSKTLIVTPSTYYQIRQLRDPSDPNAIEQAIWTYGIAAQYTPLHKRWYTGADITYVNVLDQDPLYVEDTADDDDVNDSENQLYSEAYYGKKFGPKWLIELRARTDNDSSRHQIMFVRDLHDWLAQLILLKRVDTTLSSEEESNDENNFEIKFKMTLKAPDEEVVPTNLDISTVLAQEKRSQLDETGR